MKSGEGDFNHGAHSCTVWQIEPAFKRLKSLFERDQVPGRTAGSIYAWFYGKLPAAELSETLVNAGRFPPGKSFTSVLIFANLVPNTDSDCYLPMFRFRVPHSASLLRLPCLGG
jgi:hypothetical protein